MIKFRPHERSDIATTEDKEGCLVCQNENIPATLLYSSTNLIQTGEIDNVLSMELALVA